MIGMEWMPTILVGLLSALILVIFASAIAIYRAILELRLEVSNLSYYTAAVANATHMQMALIREIQETGLRGR